MDVREATRTAREYVSELFAAEGISRACLEEAVYDPDANQWRVTLSFIRHWDTQKSMDVNLGSNTPQIYKVVVINDGDGRVVLTDRHLPKSVACCKPQPHSRSVCCAEAGNDEKLEGNNETSRQDWSQVRRTIRRILLYPVSGTGIGSAIAILLQVFLNLQAGEVAFIPMLGLGVGAMVALFAGDREFQRLQLKQRKNRASYRG